MAGTISSLGLGSGTLTSDVIDKLKASDTAARVTPFDNKIALEQQKGQALSLLSTLLGNFGSSISSLSDSTLFQGRTVSGNTSSVNVTSNAGVNVQSFTVSNTQMALNDIKESGTFASADSTVATIGGTMKLSLQGGASLNVNYTAGMSLTQLKDAINTQAGTSVKASVLQVGSGDYRLVLRSADTGADQAITVSDTSGNLDTNIVNMQVVQNARDATFKYNGITLTRSSNTITDLIPGATINLLADDNTTTANISIAQDVTAVSGQMSTLVQSYNTLVSQLGSMTSSDTASGKVGIFSGDNTINSIGRELSRMITSVNDKGMSLAQYGIGLNEDGTMSFDSSAFNTKFTSDPAAAETYFTNVAADNNSAEDGIFTQFHTLMNRYTGANGLMSTLTTASSDEIKTLNTNKTREQALIQAKYDTMSARFAQYDSIISQLNNSFSTLQQQITMAVNGTNK